MDLIDTHAHLQFEKFDPDRGEVCKRNSEKLFAIINPGAKIDSSTNGVQLASQFPNFYAAVGVHPHHSREWDKETLNQLEGLITKPKVVGVGEIGLDNYLYSGYPQPNLKEQTAILIPQIELAIKHKLPILFHCREAYDELYEIIKNYRPLQGLVHCFMGDSQIAKKFTDLGLLISFAGNLTYKANEAMRQAAAYLPKESLVIETDSPYLAPEPKRGERNEPSNVIYVAKTIATVRKSSLAEVASFTTSNARRLFSI